MVLPVVLFAVIANILEVFMFSTACFERIDMFNQNSIPRKESLFCDDGKELVLTLIQSRMNRYVTLAELLFMFLNTIVPVILMMILISLSFRDIKKGLISFGSTPNEYEDLQKKHDLDLCLRTTYAVFFFGICHGMEFITMGFEILLVCLIFKSCLIMSLIRLSQDSNIWIYNVYIFTNMLVAVACSINYFAYYGVYGRVLQSNTAENGDTECRSQMNTNL
eukprot:GFUD01062825.1.p1 GENE.GFUD01062825.1~~GFUD01062825.1.p1  ORF type:complete len:235 (+),score=9.15 GFUD01062825.1:45-707(+)